jgi:hypothetical protein
VQSGRIRKISHPSGFDPKTVQPVTSRCTHTLSRLMTYFLYPFLIIEVLCISDFLVNCLLKWILQNQFVISCLEWVHFLTCNCVCFNCEILYLCRFILTQREHLIGLRNLICLIYHHSFFFSYVVIFLFLCSILMWTFGTNIFYY